MDMCNACNNTTTSHEKITYQLLTKLPHTCKNLQKYAIKKYIKLTDNKRRKKTQNT
jgi:hypothetical protein